MIIGYPRTMFTNFRYVIDAAAVLVLSDHNLEKASEE